MKVKKLLKIMYTIAQWQSAGLYTFLFKGLFPIPTRRLCIDGETIRTYFAIKNTKSYYARFMER